MVIFTNSDTFNLTTEFEVLFELCLVCAVVNIFYEHTALIRVVCCIELSFISAIVTIFYESTALILVVCRIELRLIAAVFTIFPEHIALIRVVCRVIASVLASIILRTYLTLFFFITCQQ